jgi:hypothetical protein
MFDETNREPRLMTAYWDACDDGVGWFAYIAISFVMKAHHTLVHGRNNVGGSDTSIITSLHHQPKGPAIISNTAKSRSLSALTLWRKLFRACQSLIGPAARGKQPSLIRSSHSVCGLGSAFLLPCRKTRFTDTASRHERDMMDIPASQDLPPI